MNSTSKRHIVFASIGSWGDMYPFLTLAYHLRQKGHQIAFLTNPYYSSEVVQRGLEFVPLGSAQRFELAMKDPLLLDPRRGPATLWKHLVAPTLDTFHLALKPCLREHGTLLLVHPLYAGLAEIARATASVQIQVTALHLSPMTFPSRHWLTRMQTQRSAGFAERSRHAILRWVERKRLKTARLELNAVRAQYGLPPVESLLLHTMQAPDRHVAMFPMWIHPNLERYALPSPSTDFIFREGGEPAEESTLATFLRAREAPILVTVGTGHRLGHHIFSQALEAVNRLSRRAIFLCADRGQAPADLPPTVLWIDFTLLRWLLPRVAAIIHPGGIGTTAEALRAGTPQVVLPFVNDQFSNAAMVKRLGVGLSLAASKTNARWLQRAVRQLESDEAIPLRCRQVAERVRSGPGIEGVEQAVLSTAPMPPGEDPDATEQPPLLGRTSKVRWGAAAIIAIVAALLWRSVGSLQAGAPAQPADAARFIELTEVDIARAEASQLPRTVPITGTLRSTRSAFVKARVMGELQALSVREGDRVQAGQVIARIQAADATPRIQQARELARSAQAQVEVAQRQFDSNQSLMQQGFISRTGLENSRSALASAQAQWQAAQAAADAADRGAADGVLRAPIAGVVAQRLVQPGEWVPLDSRVIEIMDPQQLEVEATVAVADAAQLRTGLTAELQVEGLAAPVTATLTRIHPGASSSSRSVAIYLSPAQTPGLRPGLFVHGALVTGEAAGIAVPLDAVRTDRPVPFVQVVHEGRVVHRRVTPGERVMAAGTPLMFVTGLEAGNVVLRGHVGTLREGSRLSLPGPGSGDGAPATAASLLKPPG